MRINKIQNYNYNTQFQGTIRLQNLKKEGQTIKFNTTLELDKGLAQLALRNLFKGSWENEGGKYIYKDDLSQYTEALNQTIGLSVTKPLKNLEKIELRHFKNGYSIKSDGNYKITHIREDILLD